MPLIDPNTSVAITRDIHWVGFFDAEADLHCNPYLLIDGDEAVIIDPGSIPHFPIVMRKVIELINPEVISTIIACHQDPDVCGNLPVMEDVISRDDLRIVVHASMVRLIRHYGIHSTVQAVSAEQPEVVLQSGRVLECIPTPYLHSPGAIAVYDRQTKTLFSSDLFGAVEEDEWQLFSSDMENFPHTMDGWHQALMPSNRLLKHCMERFSQLDIQRILPQHGSIIEGEANIRLAIEHLMALPCGLDLMPEHGGRV